MPGPINFDHHAHTPLDPAVRAALVRALDRADVNVHAGSPDAERVRAEVEAARAQVGALIGVAANDIVFTSGATEANGLALEGLARALESTGRRRIVVGAGEHPSVLRTAERLEGVDLVKAPLLESGVVDLDALGELITVETGLVSVAAANHETGTLQPLGAIARLARASGALVHTDLAQAAGRVALDLQDVDMASLSAHKSHGPLGIGALMVRRPTRRHLRPVLVGGGQEGGLRAGTVAAPLCIGFGVASAIALNRRGADAVRLSGLRDHLLTRLRAAVALEVNGQMDGRLPNNLNISFEGVDGEALVLHVRDRLTIATGSACTSKSLEPSHVLLAMGLTSKRAESAIRIGLGRDVTSSDVDAAADILIAAVQSLTRLRDRKRA